jgi:hypothetical protein
MRAVLLLVCVLLGCFGGPARAGYDASTCKTEHDFSFINLNRNSASKLHFGSTGATVNKDTGAVTLTSKGVFEFAPRACITKITAVTTGPVKLILKARAISAPILSSGFEKPGQVSMIAGEAPWCNVHTLEVTPSAGASITFSEIVYCPEEAEALAAGPVAGSRRARSITTRTAQDPLTTADQPITVSPYCNRKVYDDGAHAYCYAVFTYSSKNNYSVAISHNDSYYEGAVYVNENPEVYYPGEHDPTEDNLSALWICDEHIHPALKLVVSTPMNLNVTHFDHWTHTATIERTFHRRCSDEIVAWIPDNVPTLFE